MMGSPTSEMGRVSNEYQVAVTLTQGFWLGKYEVTQRAWRDVMGSEPWEGQPYVRDGDQFAVTYVSWNDAVKFCGKLTASERALGRLPDDWQYTLPTEAQWEYACRAGTTTRFSFGNDESQLGNFAWFDGNSRAVRVAFANRVGQKRANGWGLHDLHGNVSEFCLDSYSVRRQGGTDPLGTATGSRRVSRGGSFVKLAEYCRSASRIWAAASDRNFYLGFRIAAVPLLPRGQSSEFPVAPSTSSMPDK